MVTWCDQEGKRQRKQVGELMIELMKTASAENYRPAAAKN
jgi:hypothetical protein